MIDTIRDVWVLFSMGLLILGIWMLIALVVAYIFGGMAKRGYLFDTKIEEKDIHLPEDVWTKN